MNVAINKLSKARGQGFKTMFVKYAFEKGMREEYGWDRTTGRTHKKERSSEVTA